MSKEKRRRWGDLLILLVILAVITAVRWSNPPESVYLHIENEILEIGAPEETSWQIPLSSIQQVELAEDAVYPQVEGEDGKVICGVFANAQWGEHHLCVYESVPVCIALSAESGTYVFNCENAKLTRDFYRAFQELL